MSDLPGRAGDAFHLSTPASKPGSACQAYLPRNRINLDCNIHPTYSAYIAPASIFSPKRRFLRRVALRGWG